MFDPANTMKGLDALERAFERLEDGAEVVWVDHLRHIDRYRVTITLFPGDPPDGNERIVTPPDDVVRGVVDIAKRAKLELVIGRDGRRRP